MTISTAITQQEIEIEMQIEKREDKIMALQREIIRLQYKHDKLSEAKK